VIGDFQKLTQKELVTINAGLKKNKQEAIPVLAETECIKSGIRLWPGSGAGMRMESRAGCGRGIKERPEILVSLRESFF